MKITIPETSNTPYVEFLEETNRLEIEGRLLPEHPGPFFEKLYNWLDKVKAGSMNELTISFYLYYYNTTSTKRLVMFLQEIDKAVDQGLNVTVEWRYDEEDEDAHEDGLDFQKASNMEIKLIPVAED